MSRGLGDVYKRQTYDEVEKFQKFLDLADASAKGVSKAKKAKIESAKMVKGVSFEEDYKRVYPYNSLACRVLGYTSSGNVGNWGIEQYYNSQLNGVNGRAYYYFNEELDQEQSVKEPKNGNSVVSTIDMQIQKIIEQKVIWGKDIRKYRKHDSKQDTHAEPCHKARPSVYRVVDIRILLDLFHLPQKRNRGGKTSHD